ERCGDETSVGRNKFYRRACFEAIGGFVRQVMWDGIDCHRCRMEGWIACSWDEPALRFVHLRPMGSSQKNIFTGSTRHGSGQY
ncbi:MAG: glycosyl transferase family 2, partial [Cyanobacteria bacterium J06649_4]